MWSFLYHPSAHFSAWSLTPSWSIFILLPWSVRAWWFINWNSYQINDFRRSFHRLPPLEIQGWTPPSPMSLEFQTVSALHAFRISVQETPLSLGILRCHLWYMVRIFSGITHCEGLLFMVLSMMVKKKLLIRKHTSISRLECKNHPLWPKWPKLIPYLWPKQLKNHTLWGRTYLYSEIDI